MKASDSSCSPPQSRWSPKEERVVGIKCLPMRLGEFDRSGRRRPEEAGDAFIVPTPITSSWRSDRRWI